MSGNINSQHINRRGEYVNWGIKWLLDHHTAKEQERRRMVDDLNLKPGDIVLDLGCGPGLWTSLLAEKVKLNGRIVGLDSDADFISYASEKLAIDQSEGIIEFHEGDFRSVPFEDESFDLVLFGNCFAYVTDHQKVLEEQKRVTRKGGRIAVKDFQGSVLVVNPIEPLLTLKVVTAAAQALKENPSNPPFDNFSGQKLRGLLLKAGLKNGASDFLMGIYCMLWFLPVWIMNHAVLPLNTIGWPNRISRPSPSAKVLRTSALTPAFRPCWLESRPTAREWPFPTSGLGIMVLTIAFLLANHNMLGAPIKMSEAPYFFNTLSICGGELNL